MATACMNADWLALCAETEPTLNTPTPVQGTVGGVGLGLFGKIGELFRAWRDAGMKVGDFWTWLPVILQMIQVIGPKIMEIIQLIRDAINNNVTPKMFNVDTAVAGIAP